MIKKLIAAAIVLALSTLLCVTATSAIEQTINEGEVLVLQAEAKMEADDATAARECLSVFEEMWNERRPLMEILTSHQDLHDVSEHLVNACACLESGQPDDFYLAAKLMREALDHIRDQEQLRLSNLL